MGRSGSEGTPRKRKVCVECKKRRTVAAFGPQTAAKDGLRSRCRDCMTAYNHAYMLKYRFGLTVEEFDEMVRQQGGRCAICEDPLDNPHIDHCHESGQVRQLLCNPCNLGLGWFRDDVARLMSAAIYLLDHSVLSAP